MNIERPALRRLMLALAGSFLSGVASADIQVYTDAQGTLVFTDLSNDLRNTGAVPVPARTVPQAPDTGDARLTDDEDRDYLDRYERAMADTGD